MLHSCIPSLTSLFAPSPSLSPSTPPNPNDITNIPYSSWRPPTCPRKCEGLCPHLPVGGAARVNGRLVQSPIKDVDAVGVWGVEGAGAGKVVKGAEAVETMGDAGRRLTNRQAGENKGKDVVNEELAASRIQSGIRIVVDSPTPFVVGDGGLDDPSSTSDEDEDAVDLASLLSDDEDEDTDADADAYSEVKENGQKGMELDEQAKTGRGKAGNTLGHVFLFSS